MFDRGDVPQESGDAIGGESLGGDGLDRAAAAGAAAAAGVLSTMASIPADSLSDAALTEVTLALEQARRFLDAAELSWLGELDRRGVTEAMFGHRTGTWLSHEAGLPRAVAAARVRTARRITSDLTSVGEALRDGRIGFDHARVFADAANPRNSAELAGVADELCDAAGVTSFERWSGEVRGLADMLDADGGNDPAGDLPDPRLSLNRVGDVTALSGQLTGDGAHLAEATLDQMADELFASYIREKTLTGAPVPNGRSCWPRLSLSCAEGPWQSTHRRRVHPGPRRRWSSTRPNPIESATHPAGCWPTRLFSSATQCCGLWSPRSTRFRWRPVVPTASQPHTKCAR